MTSLPVVLPRLTGAALALASGVGAVAIADGPGRSITYAGRSTAANALVLCTGLTLVVAALAMLFTHRATRIVDLLLLSSITWYAPVWVGWTGGPPAVRSIASVLAGFTFVFVLHAVLAYPSGRMTSRLLRALIAAVYLEASLTAATLALFRDPYFDPSCWANCSVNSFLLTSRPSFVRAAERTDRWSVAAVGIVLIAICGVRLIRSSRPARARLAPIAIPAIVFAAAVVAHAVALESMTVEYPFDTALFTIFLITSWSLILLAGGFSWSVARAHAERRAVARIAANLGAAPAPGTLRGALADALRDPQLRIAYWLPHEQRYIDAEGDALAEPIATPARAVTRLTRKGQAVAVVDHAATASDIEDQIGPAVRLGIENERLQAEVRAQLEELRASRARVVETADDERRRLERDLHDGAQQRLLALSYEIRLARASAQTDGDAVTESTLARAVEQTQAALDELRELARGIYPAVLTEAGLGAALQTLADVAPLPLEILPIEDERYPAPVETAAYFAVAEAVDSAAERGANQARVRVAHNDGNLIITVKDNGADSVSPLAAIADRVGALGGSLLVTQTECRAVIPCG
jgi:signal transduction histidine kinase